MAGGLIDFHSTDGERLLKEVQEENKYYQPNIIQIFEKQKGMKNCGIQSCSLLLNSALLGKKCQAEILKWIPELPYKEEKMFTFEKTLNVTSQEKIETNSGLTLEMVFELLKSHGHDVEIVYASESSADEFRTKLKCALSSRYSKTGIIINYFMGTLGQGMNFGHHSPLAGYSEKEDRALIMDTWIHTKECWAKVDDIFNAMNTEDDGSGKSRGYILFSENKYI